MKNPDRHAVAPTPVNMADLLALALALEIEASERYADLADLMEAHNNYDVASLFRKMAGIEQLHVTHIRELGQQHRIKSLADLSYLPRAVARIQVNTGKHSLGSIARYLNPLTWYGLARRLRGLHASLVHIVGVHEWNPALALLCRLLQQFC